jgi:hypothetical protein
LAGEKDVMACGQEELAQRARGRGLKERGQDSGVGCLKDRRKRKFLDRIYRILQD